MTNEDKLDDILLKYVGDNVGEGCTCTSCESSREVVRKAITDAIDQATRQAITDLMKRVIPKEMTDNDADGWQIGNAMRQQIINNLKKEGIKLDKV